MLLVLPIAVLAVALVLAVARVRALQASAAQAETEAARLAAELNARRARVAALEDDLAALQASEASYRTLVDGAEDWIWASDQVGTLTFSNAAGAELLGYPELVGRAAAELTHPDDAPVVMAAGGWSGVVRRRHADGSFRTVDSRSIPVRDAAGGLAGWRGIDRDLTAPVPALPGPLEGPEPEPKAPLDRPGVAIVRLPVVNGKREVVGYELVGDGRVFDGFAPDEIEQLGGGRPIWIDVPGSFDPLSIPPVDRTVLQIGPDGDPERARQLREDGFALALSDFDGGVELLEHAGIVKIPTTGRSDVLLAGLIAEPARRGLVLVATGVATADEFTRCRVLGFSHFQGEFFARPRGERGGDAGAGVGALGSLQTLGELTAAGASFEDLERTIGSDVGLSISLLRYVNSAFFALPREIDSVREALALLGTRAVRRWATVMALSAIPEAPDQLVALALLRGRMCELLGHGDTEEERDRMFTVGLFSVADALLDTPMSEILASLPFSEEITAALLRREGRKGRLLATVLRYEQGRFPDAGGDPLELADAYLAALRWADEAGRWVADAPHAL
jgi:EAL and modified HD-GYP domain-containing signal transduction protein